MAFFEKKELQTEPMEIDYNWTNLPNFIPSLTQSWQNHNFTYSQTQEWINIGLTPNDYALAAWLRDLKQLTPEQVLNHEDINTLRQEFQAYQQQAQILYNPSQN